MKLSFDIEGKTKNRDKLTERISVSTGGSVLFAKKISDSMFSGFLKTVDKKLNPANMLWHKYRIIVIYSIYHEYLKVLMANQPLKR